MIIYKVTNLQNLKVYIGQTINKFEKRKIKHYSEAKLYPKLPFARALIKYDQDDMLWEIIDGANNKYELDEKEKFWIWFYNSNDSKHGYNCTIGGKSIHLSAEREAQRINKIKKEVHQYDLNGKYLKTYISTKYAMQEFNDVGGIITKVARKNGYSKTAYGFRWSYSKVEQLSFTTNKRKVNVYDLNMKLIDECDSVSEASRLTKIPTTNISKCCKGKMNRAKNFKFKYYGE